MMHGRRLSFAAVAVAAMATLSGASVVQAQRASEFETFRNDGAGRAPTTSCRDLRGLTGIDLSIDSATLVPARGDAPEACVVQGQIPPEVRFEVRLPTAWNGRLYMFGNGGTAGEPLDLPDRTQRGDNALRGGFAVAQTNTGHDGAREPWFSFALESQKLIDYAYRAVHVTALVAKRIAQAYYDRPPAHSYFAGCSTGGRQGLMSAQRFPEDFDGILVGAPVIDIPVLNVQLAVAQRALAVARFSPEKVQRLSALVQQKCDGVDGLLDGQIDDPRRCSVDFATAVPVCAAGENSASCLTASELNVLNVFGRDITSAGRSIFPAFPVGTGILAPDPSAARGSVAYWLGEGDEQPRLASFFKYAITPGKELDWRTFDPDRDIDTLKTSSTLLNATDPDLARFRARGGKLIMYHGWAEQQLNPLVSINYRDSVRDVMGPATDDFIRLFMMPGMLHCRGGVGDG